MNVDTDTQYAFTRPIAGHMFSNYDGVLKIDGEVGNKKAYDPRSYLKAAETGMAARVVAGLRGPAVGRPVAAAADRDRTRTGNLLGEPPATACCPPNPEADAELAAGTPAGRGRGPPPRRSAPRGRRWPRRRCDRPERQLRDTVEAYAYARTGYHRGLDALRRNGWKGFGPVPWSHEPNRGFLRCVTVLAKAAEAIGEADEHERCLAAAARLRPRPRPRA